MQLTDDQRTRIEAVITGALRKKLRKYNPADGKKTKMPSPFNVRLLGKNRMALHSFVHSIGTSIGMSVFEQTAVVVAEGRFPTVEYQADLSGPISGAADVRIQRILDELQAKRCESLPRAGREIGEIRRVCRAGDARRRSMSRVDVRLVDDGGSIFLLDFKTVYPNKEGFKGMKRQLLEWIAATLHQSPDAEVSAFLALPYNPYEPAEYNWMHVWEIFERGTQVKVGPDMWDFLGGKGAYQEVLDCFERAGISMREELDAYFARFIARFK